MMEFLYFPEDKAEYIPALISLAIFVLGAVLAMYFFYKKSKKDEQKFNEQLEQYGYHRHPNDESKVNEDHSK